MSIRALLFDTGDTLWRFSAPPAPESVLVAATAQIETLLARWNRRGIDARALARDILAGARAAEREAAASLLSPDYLIAVAAAASFRGLSPGPDELEQLWRAAYVDPATLGRQPYPDARTTLLWARQSGFRVGIVANSAYGSAIVGTELAAVGLADLVEALSLSSEGGWLKPHPRIFMDAVRGLGVKPEETVMVGDTIAQDIKGAFTLGMTTVWKRNGRGVAAGERLEVTPDFQIDDLWELRALPILRRDAAAEGA
jgi:HAD superfamily hydrolase (TIGR01509 family)